jgi:segregation and condensation protein B
MENKEQILGAIQAIVFSAEQPVSPEELASALNRYFDLTLDETQANAFAAEASAFFVQSHFGFELVYSGGGYQFLTKSDYHEAVAAHQHALSKKRLSQAALETLSIVAYKQPVTKSELEFIRGVSCDYAIQKLLERQLIEIKGKSNAPGRPVLYGTSTFFMDYFGINSLTDLPQLKEIQPEENSIGETEA